jgi:hypothetical protein
MASEKAHSIVSLPCVRNPQGSTWSEFANLSTDEEAIMAPILSPRAFIRVLSTEQTFAHLMAIHNQIFANTPIFISTPHPTSHTTFQNLKGSGRDRYAPYFPLLQELMHRNQQTLTEAIHTKGSLKLSDLANLSIGFPRDASERVIGFTTFLRYTDPENLGDERIFAFLHTRMRKIALVIASAPNLLDATMRFINAHTVTLPFDKVCGWCGRADDHAGLKKCPCRRTRYCGAECQRRHWAAHRLECGSSAAE